jgi:hypothetical protein
MSVMPRKSPVHLRFPPLTLGCWLTAEFSLSSSGGRPRFEAIAYNIAMYWTSVALMAVWSQWF